MRARFAAVLLSLSLLAPGAAYAHPAVDEGRRLVESGDYDGAASAFERALQSGALDRADLIELLEARALLEHSRRDDAALERTLLSLGSIDPSHRFGPRFPPELATRSIEAGRQLRGRLRVTTSFEPSAVGIRLVARIEGDVAQLVRETRVRVFDAALGQWTVATPPVEAATGRELLAFVEAIGPGGAVVASAGSPDEPLHVGSATQEPSDGAADGRVPLGVEEPPARRGVSDVVVGVIVAAVAAVLIGGAIGAFVYFDQNPMISYQLTSPTLD